MKIVRKQFDQHRELVRKTLDQNKKKIKRASKIIIRALRKNKILICGNGGSAADAQHFAAEIVGRFEKERKALSAIALSTDTSILTAVGNDYGFENIFERQVKALAQKGDVLFVISTSGNSENVLKAIKASKKKMRIISLTGENSGLIGKIKNRKILKIKVPSKITARIQEMHILLIHVLCKMVDLEFCKSVGFDR